jgi:hypothetical protein
MTDPPAAISAASPPLDPPGDRLRSRGFRVTPKIGLEQSYEMLVSGRLVRQKGIVPRCRRTDTIPASASDSLPRFEGMPTVVSSPLMLMCSWSQFYETILAETLKYHAHIFVNII